MTHVRNQDITVEGEFTSNSMRLKLSIDLDDLLRDGRVLGIGEWDANGSFRETLNSSRDSQQQGG
jgi:hypothetical protein